jgi:hypothetical protein
MWGAFIVIVGIIGFIIMGIAQTEYAFHKMIEALEEIDKVIHIDKALAQEHFVRDWKDDVLDKFEEAGIDRDIIRKVIACESSWNPYAVNKNRNGSIDRGILQINSIHKVPAEIAFDPMKATEWAIDMYHSGKGLTPWVCYTSGKYRYEK